jgi:hypothetical protein
MTTRCQLNPKRLLLKKKETVQQCVVSHRLVCLVVMLEVLLEAVVKNHWMKPPQQVPICRGGVSWMSMKVETWQADGVRTQSTLVAVRCLVHMCSSGWCITQAIVPAAGAVVAMLRWEATAMVMAMAMAMAQHHQR